jgi:predicted nucleic acid-binding protein
LYLVDTNIVSVGSPVWEAAPAALVSWMEENSAGLYLSAVTIAEIEDGIAKLRREKAGRKAQRLSAWLDALLHLYGERVLSFGLQEARVAGALSDSARAKGRSPGFADIVIAATASAHNLVLLTRNERHFEPLGVKTINPFEALPRRPGM